MPKLKMVTSLQITNDESAINSYHDNFNFVNVISNYFGLDSFNRTERNEQPVYMGKENYNIDMVIQFYDRNRDA